MLISGQLKILRSDPALLKALENDFYHDNTNATLDPPTVVKGGIILPLSLTPAGTGYTAHISARITSPTEIRPQLQFSESGGATATDGSACCWCGSQGERLYAYYLPAGRRSHSCGTHAWYAVGKPVIGAETGWDEVEPDLVIVTRYALKLNWNTRELMVYVDHLWDGNPAELPGGLKHLRGAVQASVEKAHCVGCREAHFAKMAVAKEGAA